MEWILGALGGGGIAIGARYVWSRRVARRADAEELEQIRQIADEDVTLFGEELTRLDAELNDDRLDDATQEDFQRALDAYEGAQRAITHLTDLEQISTVTDALASGRYAVVCVRARVAHQPVPERRVPCFFNPQHGPSTADVVWNQPKWGTRSVPVCAQDAARLKAGERPDIRSVMIGDTRVPYWEAGRALSPYRKGYFAEGHGRGSVPMAVYENSLRNVGMMFPPSG